MLPKWLCSQVKGWEDRPKRTAFVVPPAQNPGFDRPSGHFAPDHRNPRRKWLSASLFCLDAFAQPDGVEGILSGLIYHPIGVLCGLLQWTDGLLGSDGLQDFARVRHGSGVFAADIEQDGIFGGRSVHLERDHGLGPRKCSANS